MYIPAFCDNPSCGSIYSSGIFVEGALNINLSGNISGPCPRCGGWGHIPDGVFNFIENTITIISAPERTLKDLEVFTEIIRVAKESGMSQDEVIRNVEDRVPVFLGVLKLLPETRDQLYSFLAVIIALITLVQNQKSQETNIQNITINQVVERVYEIENECKEVK